MDYEELVIRILKITRIRPLLIERVIRQNTMIFTRANINGTERRQQM